MELQWKDALLRIIFGLNPHIVQSYEHSFEQMCRLDEIYGLFLNLRETIEVRHVGFQCSMQNIDIVGCQIHKSFCKKCIFVKAF